MLRSPCNIEHQSRIRRKMSDKFIVRIFRRTSTSRVLHPSRKDEDRKHHLGPGPEHDAPSTSASASETEQLFRGKFSDGEHPIVRLVLVYEPKPEDGRDGQRIFRKRSWLGTGIDFSAENDEPAWRGKNWIKVTFNKLTNIYQDAFREQDNPS